MKKNKKQKITVKKLDTLWSFIVRSRDEFTCQICGDDDWRNIQAMHIIGRGEWAVRWELGNGIAGCRRCHKYYTHRPAAWQEWIDADSSLRKRYNRLRKMVSKWYTDNCPKLEKEKIYEFLKAQKEEEK